MERRLTTARDRHFEGGLDHMLAAQVALPRLLIAKGLITREEWDQKVEEVLKEVKARQLLNS